MTSDEPGAGSVRPPRLVRPYVLTQGRTTGWGGALALDACVYATTSAVDTARPDETPEARRIVDLCSGAPMAIAEVAGRMMLPLGVIRVLVSDLTGTGVLAVGEAAAADAGKDVRLLERLLDGIRTL